MLKSARLFQLVISFFILLSLISCGEAIPAHSIDRELATALRSTGTTVQASPQISFLGILEKAPEGGQFTRYGQIYRLAFRNIEDQMGLAPSLSVYICTQSCVYPLKPVPFKVSTLDVGQHYLVKGVMNSYSLYFNIALLETVDPISPLPSLIPSPTPSPSPSPIPSALPKPSPTPTPAPSPSPSPIPPKPSPSPIPSPTPIVNPTPSPTVSPAPLPTQIPSAEAQGVFLVVNVADADSRDIADYYIQLRGIPSNNVFSLSYSGDPVTTDINTFRASILSPILSALSQRGLSDKIHTIVYSSGFPPEIRYSADITGTVSSNSIDAYPSGSLTGFTYLQADVMAKNKSAYTSSSSNPYYSSSTTRVFAGSYNGKRYYQSVMLGVTRGKNGGDVNTVTEVKNYLSRAKAADGSNPRGTVYFMRRSGEIRSDTRQGQFNAALSGLTALGVAAKIVDQPSTYEVIPYNTKDLMGAVVGSAQLYLDKSMPGILPGAIAEHLTSNGASFGDVNQSHISQWLRYGAAGSSGTVTEPYALAWKFPNAYMHVHYARGATLGQAFYQSVQGPYQLLIVGDPLCKPWVR